MDFLIKITIFVQINKFYGKMRQYCFICIYCLVVISFVSCVKIKDIYEQREFVNYLYDYNTENSNIECEIRIHMNDSNFNSEIETQIPVLKYNKTWLIFLTQDDCMHDAFSNIWAAINGKPLHMDYYYDIAHLVSGDLPLGTYKLNKTLGYTNGTGKEIRFAFTTTILPESESMNETSVVRLGYKGDYYRFYKKQSLIWDNIVTMLNYGVSIAFHDVSTSDVHNVDSIVKHYKIAQNIIRMKLNGRAAKVLAEPNGNIDYIKAAIKYEPIQFLTAQENADRILYPFKVEDDMYKGLYSRYFYNINLFKSSIENNLKAPKEERKAINIGVHGTNHKWVSFLEWINDQYGKDGDDTVWFPSLEEYYEYNYYRIHSKIETDINNNVIIIKIKMPSGQDFYYPSITLNVKGIHTNNIKSIETDDVITGFGYGDYNEGLMLNIDFYKNLYERAKFYSEQYIAYPSSSNLEDALYFINQLKASNKKQELLRMVGY